MAVVPYIKMDPIVRGDGVVLLIEAVEGDGTPLNLDGAEMWFTAKPAYDNDVLDAAAIIRKSTDDGITLLAQSGATEGHAEVDIDPEDTDALLAERTNLVIDVQYMELGGDPVTLLRGVLPVIPDVTRRVTMP